MKVVLCGLEPGLLNAWAEAVGSYEDPNIFEIAAGDITALEARAVVSPANSFGFMDGGVDLAYSRALGWHVQDRLQKKIQELPFKELLVGQALSVSTDDERIPWLISAPTMRIPCVLSDPWPVFLASRAATAEAIRLEVSRVAFPGMGTGTGGVPYKTSACLMVRGIGEAIQGREFPKSLRSALARAEVLRQ